MLPWFMAMAVFGGIRMAEAGPEPSAAPFRHVVLFKFKDDVSEAQIREVEEAFRKLPETIDAIVDFEWGRSETVETELARGYTHAFLVTFRDRAGLQEYLPHPEHEKFVSLVRPLLEEAHVFDYTARD